MKANSKEKILNVESIGDMYKNFGWEQPKHPLVNVMPLNEEVANYNYGNVTYVFGFYQIALQSGVKGSIIYGRNSYDFQDGTMIFGKPEQAFQYKNNTYEPTEQGWILYFHPDLIRKTPLAKTIDSYSFFSYESHEALHLSLEEKESLTALVRNIEQEYQSNTDQHSHKLIIATIELMLDYCTRYYERQFYVRSDLNKDALSKFEHLLQEYYNSGKPLDMGVPTVKYCGEQLNMSPYYLSDMLKKETGNNAQQHIQKFVIERAKTQLLNSNEQVGHIAYELGFEYPQHFSKLFKSKTGMSPVEYRNRS